MTVLSSTDLREIGATIIKPFLTERVVHGPTGLSYGLSSCGYDVRLKQDVVMWPGRCFLGSTVEQFKVPIWARMTIFDKSTLARKFLTVQNTLAEPNWRGHLTLELVNHSWRTIRLYAGQPIAQVCIERLSSPSDRPYTGKYQNQPDMPVGPIEEQPRLL